MAAAAGDAAATAETRTVVCPLCSQTLTATSEEECIQHISTCKGFIAKHGNVAREKRKKKRTIELPSAADAGRLPDKYRVAKFSNDGSFTERVPQALMDVLEWWRGTETSRKITLTAENDDPDAYPRPWSQDDGTDRFYWHMLMLRHPDFASIYATSEGAPAPSLIAPPESNSSQTAREQCRLDGLASFSRHKCALCGLDAKRHKSQCSRCKTVHYCSPRCQIEHWRAGHKRECKALPKARQETES